MPTRAATAVRIHCPVAPATLDALRRGDAAVLAADPALAAMLALIRGADPDSRSPLGDFGVYTGVVEMAAGMESFVPTAAARPTAGTAGAISLSPTVILTTYVADDADPHAVAAALDALVAAHPWEIPVIETYPTTLLTR